MLKNTKNFKYKLDLFVYYFQIVYIVLAILLLFCNIFLFIYTIYYHLTNLYQNAIIGLIFSVCMIISYFINNRFKEVRKKFRKIKEGKDKNERKCKKK